MITILKNLIRSTFSRLLSISALTAVSAAVIGGTSAFSVYCAEAVSDAGEDVLRIAVLGDSYSAFRDDVGDDRRWFYPYWSTARGIDVSTEDQMWYSLLEQKLGADIGYIEAVNSVSVTAGVNKYCRQTSNLALHIPEDQDVVIVMAGINDIWGGAPVGSTILSENVPASPVSYTVGLKNTFRNIRRNDPDAVICYVLMCSWEDSERYRRAAEAVCRSENAVFTALTEIDTHEWHPTVLGMQQISDQISLSIEQYFQQKMQS